MFPYLSCTAVILAVLFGDLSFGNAQNFRSYENGQAKLYYEEHGEGPPIYILSGGPGQAPEQPYHQIIDSLKASYTCVLLHQRGSGQSRNIVVDENTITIENYTQDIELLRKLRNDKTITILGVSWGGLLAMNYAAQHAQSVSNLILVSSAPPSYKLWNVLFDNQFARRSKIELDSLNALQLIFSTKTERQLDSLKVVSPNCKEVLAYKAFIEIAVRAMYYDRSKLNKEQIDKVFYSFNFQPIRIIDDEVINTRWDITNKLKALKTPTMIIYGRQDDQGESTFHLQKESLKFSEVHIVEKCGHEIISEQPVEFFRILKTYLKMKK